MAIRDAKDTAKFVPAKKPKAKPKTLKSRTPATKGLNADAEFKGTAKAHKKVLLANPDRKFNSMEELAKWEANQSRLITKQQELAKKIKSRRAP